MNELPHSRILIAGIGNIFLGDDGFGCETVQVLRQMHLPADVKVIDYGIRGFDLAYALLESYETVIFVDAVSQGGAPGTIYLLEITEDSSGQDAAMNPHSIAPRDLLAMARSLGEVPSKVLIVGCEPADFGDELEGRMQLSAAVAASVPRAVDLIMDVVESRLVQSPGDGDGSVVRGRRGL